MNKQQLVKSFFWLTLAEVIFNISGYVIHSAVGRMLGPAEYGRYGIIITLTTMVIILLGNGIPTAMSKFLSEYYESQPSLVAAIKRKSAYLQTIFISIITVTFFFLAPMIAWLLSDPTLTPLFRISSLIIPAFASVSFYFFYFTGIHQFKIQAFLKIVRSLSRLVIIIGLVYYFGLTGSITGYIIAPALVFISAWLIDHYRFHYRHSRLAGEDNQFDWKKIVTFAWPITLFMLFYELLISLDLYLVKGILKSDYLTGIYNGSLTISRIPYYLFYALTTMLLPVIAKSAAQNNPEKTQAIIREVFRLMIIVLAIIVILMVAYAYPIISLFYGKNYLPGAIPLQILSVGVGFLTVFYVMSFVANGAGKIKIPMWIACGGMIMNAALNFILIQKYQLVGSAIATSVTSLFCAGFIVYFVNSIYSFLPKLSSFIKIALASALTYAASLLLPAPNSIFILYGILLSAFFFLILFILHELKKDDWQLFLSMIRRSKK